MPSLRCREIERGGDCPQVSISVEERKAFISALKGLHKAGVRHHDSRADNLLIDSRGQVPIIDLDCADFTFDEEKFEEVLECLTELLEG
ncbi:hypothetical protein CPB84DRAFT_1772461 [Gymnopilus junonius]|uniref:Protein kinase domain-containing protein n=1 Tax=Gymnopilus junonius TaxID=109634 RepID=A0A9P5TPK9_GYMJU|nr:hypothetical protein CPB84DRAFT_1772461 [Gymnopilus junonius]